jgi:hypothetical protein
MAKPGNSSELEAAVQRAEKEIGDPRAALYHLAVPPAALFSMMGMLGESGLAKGARVIIEKPFGTDLASARAQPSRPPPACAERPRPPGPARGTTQRPSGAARYFRGQRPAQLQPREIRQQAVVAEPPAPGVQRFDERVSVFEVQQDRFRARPTGQQTGQLAMDPVEHRGGKSRSWTSGRWRYSNSPIGSGHR